ncbi:MAG: PHP-associated domain-containing protein [Candidatus Bipolaricaulaceae bacterium]
MRWFRADLHIHSTLSPCGSLAMSPRRIVEEARKAGLSLIAICDHNAGENGVYARRLARGSPTVLMGMEIQTAEEVEVLALFPEEEPCLSLQDELYSLLPPIPNDPELFGDQVVVDEREEIVRTVEKLLLSPVPLSLAEVVARVEGRGGLVIPAHVDRVPGGLLGVLGIFPPGEWPAVEISPWAELSALWERWPELRGRVIFRSSDAHYPEEIGRAWTELYLREPSFSELLWALEGKDGRRVRPGPPMKEGK